MRKDTPTGNRVRAVGVATPVSVRSPIRGVSR